MVAGTERLVRRAVRQADRHAAHSQAASDIAAAGRRGRATNNRTGAGSTGDPAAIGNHAARVIASRTFDNDDRDAAAGDYPANFAASRALDVGGGRSTGFERGTTRVTARPSVDNGDRGVAAIGRDTTGRTIDNSDSDSAVVSRDATNVTASRTIDNGNNDSTTIGRVVPCATASRIRHDGDHASTTVAEHPANSTVRRAVDVGDGRAGVFWSRAVNPAGHRSCVATTGHRTTGGAIVSIEHDLATAGRSIVRRVERGTSGGANRHDRAGSTTSGQWTHPLGDGCRTADGDARRAAIHAVGDSRAV